jgi:hypothetical protein
MYAGRNVFMCEVYYVHCGLVMCIVCMQAAVCMRAKCLHFFHQCDTPNLCKVCTLKFSKTHNCILAILYAVYFTFSNVHVLCSLNRLYTVTVHIILVLHICTDTSHTIPILHINNAHVQVHENILHTVH